ncbi:MAG TPA: bifunctional hydroxymethylpyrimidine kinase/phosphomethylpyrimidine kinase [Longimicrobiales bacterium]|nr:bifunctional hydroxymethylpyrimidine kinase/phosphomethylpyrimidine kinase [Longimicrobiales bacterium]
MISKPASLKTALTIAGSDSGGGAGIQADLKTFHVFGVFGTSAITAITAQNTLGVHAVHAVPADIVRAQIHAVASDFRPTAFKTGMLATASLVGVVADAIEQEALPRYVLDPVMVSTSRHRLLDVEAERAIVERLLPLCELVTPNLPEAMVLLGVAPDDAPSAAEGEQALRDYARALVGLGARAALVKGGHLAGAEVIDVLYDGRDYRVWRGPKLETAHTHGTGCTLSAAVTAGLAQGRTLAESVERALAFVGRAIAAAPGLGDGHGPLNHFVTAD